MHNPKPLHVDALHVRGRRATPAARHGVPGWGSPSFGRSSGRLSRGRTRRKEVHATREAAHLLANQRGGATIALFGGQQPFHAQAQQMAPLNEPNASNANEWRKGRSVRGGRRAGGGRAQPLRRRADRQRTHILCRRFQALSASCVHGHRKQSGAARKWRRRSQCSMRTNAVVEPCWSARASRRYAKLVGDNNGNAGEQRRLAEMASTD